MTTALEALTSSQLAQRGIVQQVKLSNGITLDQDGNRFPDALTKYKFLTECLALGIRSGNLQPVTTANQRADLINRINATARRCGQPEI